LSKVLATAAVLQNSSAHSRALALADATRGVAAASDLPSGGHRPEMDDLLNLPERVIVPEGAKPSAFVDSHFQRAEAFLQQLRFFGSVEPGGLACELPFSGYTPAMYLRQGEPLQTSFLDLSTETPHPEAGNGLLCLMRLPYEADPDRIALDANRLNLLESAGQTGTLLLGAWAPDPSSNDTLAFCAFVPNLLARWVLVENLVYYMASHSRLAADVLAESRSPERTADSDWEMADSGVEDRHRTRPEASTNLAGTPSGAELAQQARELAKSTARASAKIANSAAKLGMAALRKRLSENGKQD
ncbi:MAG: hypothetical protein ACKOI2_14305, partial [Actinomycetota bacterium]